jgi:putative FmdB family regulatory protein
VPAYDYDCAACGRRFEVVHGVHAAPPTACPDCGSDRIRKAISAPAVHYRGSGWAKKERRSTATPRGSKPEVDGGSGDTASSDAEPKGDKGDKGDKGSAEGSEGRSTPAKSVETAAAGTAD